MSDEISPAGILRYYVVEGRCEAKHGTVEFVDRVNAELRRGARLYGSPTFLTLGNPQYTTWVEGRQAMVTIAAQAE